MADGKLMVRVLPNEPTIFQGVYFVHSFESTAFRLAIPRQYRKASIVSVALSLTAGHLIVGSVVPPVVVCLFIMIAVSPSNGWFSGSVWMRRLDVFLESFLCCVMQFDFPLGSLKFPVKCLFALVLFFEFLVLNDLRGEVVSIAQNSRIPASGCSFSYCANEVARDILIKGESSRKDIFNDPTLWDRRAVRPVKGHEFCDKTRRERKAFRSVSYGEETILTSLFMKRALCGESDLIKAQANSIRGIGLLLEENIVLRDRSTQLCVDYPVSWILRKALENSLFTFTRLGKRDGPHKGRDQKENEFWASNDSYTREVKTYLKNNTAKMKDIYIKNHMHGEDGNEPLSIEALRSSGFLSFALIILSAAALTVENCAKLRAVISNSLFMKRMRQLTAVVADPETS